MEKTVQQIPFLRPTILLAFGIYAGSLVTLPMALLFAISIFLLLVCVSMNRNYTFRRTAMFGASLHLLLFFTGVLVFGIYNSEPVFVEKGTFVATVLEKPQERKNSYKSLVQVSAVENDSSVLYTRERILVYFEKHDKAKKLNPGDVILFSASPVPIKNYGNPFEFDYQKYLRNKKIYRQLYLPISKWKSASVNWAPKPIIQAEQFREKLLGIYRQQQLGKNELEILSALTLGYKRNLDPETRQVFSAAGAMHVLAVSGLHVGIIYLVILFLFGFLRKQKTGRIIFVFITIVLLWAYAFITGLSPSVMRAATMFTLFAIGENINRRPNSYNALAASAMFLLLLNPNNLFEVGFQLSYTAVFGILFLQPKLFQLIDVKNRIAKYCWALLTVSLAAQIATFPITAFYFHQFPTYFWLANLFVIPAVTALIPLGMLLLIVAKIPLIPTFVAALLQFILKSVYSVLSVIEQFPLAVCKISIYPGQLLLLLAALLALMLFIKSHRALFVKISLLATLLLVVSSFIYLSVQNKATELIVYNAPRSTTIQLIKGRANFVIYEAGQNKMPDILNTVKNTNNRFNLNPPTVIPLTDSFSNDYLLLRHKILIFEGKTILMCNDFSDCQKAVSSGFIINPKSCKNLASHISENTRVIITGKSSKRANLNLNTVYETSKRGAFIEKW